jgi:hypothetical protein
MVARHPLLVTLGVAAILAVVVGATLLVVHDRREPAWSCRSTDVARGTATGATADEAVRRFVATGAAPSDGWAPSEPNRWSRREGDVQMVLDVDQSNVDQFEIVRLSTCGPTT